MSRCVDLLAEGMVSSMACVARYDVMHRAVMSLPLAPLCVFACVCVFVYMCWKISAVKAKGVRSYYADYAGEPRVPW